MRLYLLCKIELNQKEIKMRFFFSHSFAVFGFKTGKLNWDAVQY
jgi:hypothetical protein